MKPALGGEYNTRHLPSQMVCKQRIPGTAHPKILQRQGRNNKPKGMRQVFLAQVLRAVISNAGQGGDRQHLLHSPRSNGARGARCLGPSPHTFIPSFLLFLTHVLSVSFHSLFFLFFLPTTCTTPFLFLLRNFLLAPKKGKV